MNGARERQDHNAMPSVEDLSDPRELRRCIRDLVALSTLPAIWTGYGPREIADSVAAALVTMLNVDFIYVALPSGREEPVIEVAHVGRRSAVGAVTEIGRVIPQGQFRNTAQTAVIPNPLGEGTTRIVTAPVGPGAILVAGSDRQDFPTETQRLLLSIAANDTTVALQRWRAEADERRFVSLVERSSDFVSFADLDGRPQYINSAGLDLVGLPPNQDVSVLNILDFVVPDERARTREEIWPTVLRNGRWLGEFCFEHFKTGEEIPFLVDAFRIDSPRDGRPMNVATVSRDLRAQKKAESELRRLNESLELRVERRTAELADANKKLMAEIAERERADLRSKELQFALSHAGRLSAAGQMAAALAHELSQPLAAVTNSANAARRMLARGGHAKIGALRKIMDDVSRQSLRAGQILRRLRDFIVRGESDMQVESIETMIEEAIAFAQTGSESLGVLVQCKFDPNARSVIANRIQIQQVLVNLIRNAFEAMADCETRELDVTTDRLNRETVEVSVIDSGPGLPRDVLAKLFEPFVSTKHDGMGLGLSICRSIVEAHGGTLRYESNPEGGTIFRFTLPSAPPAGESHVQ